MGQNEAFVARLANGMAAPQRPRRRILRAACKQEHPLLGLAVRADRVGVPGLGATGAGHTRPPPNRSLHGTRV